VTITRTAETFDFVGAATRPPFLYDPAVLTGNGLEVVDQSGNDADGDISYSRSGPDLVVDAGQFELDVDAAYDGTDFYDGIISPRNVTNGYIGEVAGLQFTYHARGSLIDAGAWDDPYGLGFVFPGHPESSTPLLAKLLLTTYHEGFGVQQIQVTFHYDGSIGEVIVVVCYPYTANVIMSEFDWYSFSAVPDSATITLEPGAGTTIDVAVGVQSQNITIYGQSGSPIDDVKVEESTSFHEFFVSGGFEGVPETYQRMIGLSGIRSLS